MDPKWGQNQKLEKKEMCQKGCSILCAGLVLINYALGPEQSGYASHEFLNKILIDYSHV